MWTTTPRLIIFRSVCCRPSRWKKAVGLKKNAMVRSTLRCLAAPPMTTMLFFYNGAMSVLQPFINKGKQLGKNKVSTLRWDGAVAQARMDNLLSAYYGKPVWMRCYHLLTVGHRHFVLPRRRRLRHCCTAIPSRVGPRGRSAIGQG